MWTGVEGLGVRVMTRRYRGGSAAEGRSQMPPSGPFARRITCRPRGPSRPDGGQAWPESSAPERGAPRRSCSHSAAGHSTAVEDSTSDGRPFALFSGRHASRHTRLCSGGMARRRPLGTRDPGGRRSCEPPHLRPRRMPIFAAVQPRRGTLVSRVWLCPALSLRAVPDARRWGTGGHPYAQALEPPTGCSLRCR